MVEGDIIIRFPVWVKADKIQPRGEHTEYASLDYGHGTLREIATP